MLGLTGGIASGKSTVSQRLRELGAFIIDADEVSRVVICRASVLFELGLAFGPGIFDNSGRLDRRALAAEAFKTAGGTNKLNSIMHPAVIAEINRQRAMAEGCLKYPLTVLDAALLIESGFYKECSGVWLVTCSEETRVARVIARDGVTEKEARQRVLRQMSDARKAAFATRIIPNDGSIEALVSSVDKAYAKELECLNNAKDQRG